LKIHRNIFIYCCASSASRGMWVNLKIHRNIFMLLGSKGASWFTLEIGDDNR